MAMNMDALLVFGCGVNRKDFETKFNALSQENQLRLEKVARRVRVTLKLKYEMGVYQNPFEAPYDYFVLVRDELPAIGIYLLVTCLDTIAGKAQFMDFRDWLKDQHIITTTNKEEIINLYTLYVNDFGVGKNLRDLFDNLPSITKEWLAKNVVFREIEQPFPLGSQPLDQLGKRLYTYFYEIRRNDFTHRCFPRQVSTAEDIRYPDETGGWVTPASGTHFELNRRKRNKLWNFSYRQGLDEATILQIIIHSAVLQILNIPVTEELINLNLRNFSRLDGLYSFVSEVGSNANVLNLWFNIEELIKSEFKSYLMYAGVPLLGDQAAKRMIDRYNVGKGWETSYHQMTLRYVQEVAQLNTTITDFNAKNPHVKPMQDNIEAHWEAIVGFLSELSRTSSAHSILNFPTTNEMANLWLIIRDPCYI